MDARSGVGSTATGDHAAMSVWYCVPSKRPEAEATKCLSAWRERGYKIAVWHDYGYPKPHPADLEMTAGSAAYPGYTQAVNLLIREVFGVDREAEWFVTGGDDVFPDPNHTAEEIAAQCTTHFAMHWAKVCEECIDEAGLRGKLGDTHSISGPPGWIMRTFGVMQPTGDRWGENPKHHRPEMRSAYIDRVCGSPWMGREFCRRINGGNGPLWSEYRHMYEDEELYDVAMKLGILWQRPDLIHYHEHWGRKPDATTDDMPEFLKAANSTEEWNKAKALYERRRAAGFPGHEPLP